MQTTTTTTTRTGRKRPSNPSTNDTTFTNPTKRVKKEYVDYVNAYTNICNDYAYAILSYNNKNSDRSREITKDEQFQIGREILWNIIEFCLVDVSKHFPLTSLQYKAFLKWLPTILPLVFGKAYYNSNKEKIHKILGTAHKKLVFYLIGARRDGKSMFQSIAMGSLFIHCNSDPFRIPFLGPGEGTGSRMITNIDSILNIPEIKEKYGHIFKWRGGDKKLRVTNRSNSKDQRIGIAKAPTDNAMRGFNSTYDAIDEAFSIPPEFTQAQCIARWFESLGACAVTNPNPKETYYQKFSKSSDTVEVMNESRVCEDCMINKIDHFDTPLKLQEYCESQQHKTPQDNPWVDRSGIKKWSKYMYNDIFARETNIGIFSDDTKFVKNKFIRQFFSQRSSAKEFKYFALGCDPSDSGNSYTAITIFGVEVGYTGNCCYHLLNCEQFHMRQELLLSKKVFDYQKQFYKQMSRLGFVNSNNNIKCYNWIEFFMHQGFPINELYKSDMELSKCCKVMRALKWDRKKKDFMVFGTSKTAEITEKYVNFMSVLMSTNRLKIHESFYTSHKSGKEFILGELQKQIMNLRREPPKKTGGKGKITAKTSSTNDDLLVSFFMVPYNMERTLRPYLNNDELNDDEKNRNSCLNSQLYFNNELPTFRY